MSRRNKLGKFADLLKYPHVYENFDPLVPVLHRSATETVQMKGKWKSDHFGNENPLTLELACGKGDYAMSLARAYPDRNIMGVDVKGARIWKGATDALAENIDNVAFLRTRIEQIGNFFEPNEVDEIWITFPDPFLRESKENRRLTSPNFLDRYKKILKPGAIIHLKTDEVQLYDYTMEVLSEYDSVNIIYHNDDIYASNLAYAELEYKTFYERMHLANGLTIKYIRFTIN